MSRGRGCPQGLPRITLELSAHRSCKTESVLLALYSINCECPDPSSHGAAQKPGAHRPRTGPGGRWGQGPGSLEASLPLPCPVSRAFFLVTSSIIRDCALSVMLFLVISTREPECPFSLRSSCSRGSRLGRGHLFWSSFCCKTGSEGRSQLSCPPLTEPYR